MSVVTKMMCSEMSMQCWWVCLDGGMSMKGEVVTVGFDHINRNPPVLIRTPKLTRFEPA